MIFSGIIVGISSGISQLVELIRTEQFSILEALLFPASRCGAAGVIFVERGQRASRSSTPAGSWASGDPGRMSYFPLRVNTAG